MSWVDFREIKQKITIPMVMEHYGLLGQFKKTRKGFRGACPIHGGQPEHKNQFHFDDRKWKCFGGCGDQLEGHVIGLVAGMENVSLRDAALKLAEWFSLDTTHPSKREGRKPAQSPPEVVGSKTEEIKAEDPAPAEPAQETGPEDEPENPELNFRLKTLTTDHPYFKARGIFPEAIQHFEAGYCSRGMFKGRIVFPLYRPKDGKLIGYTGRTVEPITDENPKWLLPSIIKPKTLFNFHRIAGEYKTIIIVEGCFSAVAVFQAGFPNVAALLGREILQNEKLSYDQFRLIRDHFDQAVLLLDGDQDGQEAAQKGLVQLAGQMFVRLVGLPENKDPDDLPQEALQELLSFLR